MDCLHRAPLQILSRYVRSVYQFDQFPVCKWSMEKERRDDHLQPRPIMALHPGNTIKIGREPTHKTYPLTKGTPLKVGLENRSDVLEPKLAQAMVVVGCPPETGIHTCDTFMKCINRHQCNVASTVASKDPEINT